MLIGQFYGTSAAEGIPAPFCRCDTCRQARQDPRLQRLRTCFRLTDTIMIDLGADAVSQSIRYGDLQEVEHILVTHTHDDHLNPHMLMEAFWSRRQRRTLHYYFTDQAFEIVEKWRHSDWILKGMVPKWEAEGIVAFHKLEYGICYDIDGIKVTPFRGNHTGNVGENSALYLLLLPDGRKMFYGLDSGPYFPQTLQALQGEKIDIFVSEATMGTSGKHPSGAHMCIEEVHELITSLYEQGTLHRNSVVYLTHINHSTSHGALLEAVEKLHFPISTIVCTDGIKIL